MPIRLSYCFVYVLYDLLIKTVKSTTKYFRKTLSRTPTYYTNL